MSLMWSRNGPIIGERARTQREREWEYKAGVDVGGRVSREILRGKQRDALRWKKLNVLQHLMLRMDD